MIQPIRLTHMITGLNPGGAESVLQRLLAGMDPERFTLSVVSLLAPGAVAPEIEKLGIPVYSLGMTQGSMSPAGLLKARRLVRKLDPHILQSWMYHADLLATMCSRFPRRGRLAWNIRQGESGFPQDSYLTRAVAGACIRLSGMPDAIVACGWNAMKNHALLGYRSERMECIPNGFDTHRFSPSAQDRADVRADLDLDPDALVVGNVARLHRYKDHPTLIRGLLEVAAAVPRSRFVLVGRDVQWENEEVQALIPDGMRHRFRLLGLRSDVPRILRTLDLYVSSSITEGFPNAIGEALSTGVPAVATDVGDSRYIVGDAGLIVPHSDPAALAGAVISILSADEQFRARLSQIGRSRIVDYFSLERMIDAYTNLYLRLAAGS